MSRRRLSRLDSLLEAWAEWCDGGAGLLGAGQSMLARVIDGKGEILFGSNGSGSSSPNDAMEVRLEGVVAQLAITNPDAADVLRMEYSAGWWSVCRRRGIRKYDPRGTTQMDRAHALQFSLRTYKRRLAEARAVIEEQLRKSL